MARKIMKETWYTFDPVNRIITFPHYVPQEHLILITDITANKVLYNFSDPSLGYTNYSSVVNSDGTETTSITLKYNTSGLSSGDEIQVTIDEYVESFQPSEEYQDGVGKLKTSTPQALIDTDFEYGAQQSKWESVSTINNRPTSWGFPYAALNVSGITAPSSLTAAGSRTITVSVTTLTATATSVTGNSTTSQATFTTSAAHGFSVGQYVTVAATSPTTYNVTAVPIIAVPTSTSFVINTTTFPTAPTALTTGTVTAGVVPPVGTPINVIDPLSLSASGRYTVEARTAENTFTYTAKTPIDSTWSGASLLDTNKTLIIPEVFYSNSTIGAAPTVTYVSNAAGSAVTVTTTVPHGLSIGNEIIVNGTSGITSGVAPTAYGLNGNYAVASITGPTSFIYYTPSTLTGTVASTATTTGTAASGSVGAIGSNILSVTATNAILATITVGMTVTGVGIPSGSVVTAVSLASAATTAMITLSAPLTAAVTATTYTFNAAIYMRPQGQVAHRAFDGGVIFQTNAGSNNQSLVRQTRRYFRYQSGKAISMSSGTILKPTLNIDNLTATGTAIGSTVVVTTKEKHNFQPGYQITIYGATDTGYNGTFTVANVISTTKFTYVNTALLNATTATGTPYVSTTAWYGAQTRLGIFDNQNGAYWEFDGQNVYAVRRASVYQVAGRVSVTQGSSTVTGSTQYPTIFNKQLVPGDWIVIRGQSYRVQDIASDTSLTISPAYRGVTANQVIVSKTVNTRIPQAKFNIDQLDGHGPTGYNLDLSKMQMFFVDFSWYGAGSIRWGLRTNRGNIAWVHRLPNNNNSATAYMRSGNLPGRYESATYPTATYTAVTINPTDTSITVADSSTFPSSGSIIVRNGSSYELMNYTGNPVNNGVYSNTLTGLTRGQGGASTATITTPNLGATGTVGSISGSGPWTATITGLTSTAGAYPGATLTATAGTGTIGGGSNTYVVQSTTSTSVTYVATGGTTPTAGSVTNVLVSSNTVTVSSAAGIQVGQRVINPSVPDGTFVSAISGTTLTLSQSTLLPQSAVATIFPAVGTAGTVNTTTTSGNTYTYSATAPTAVELAFPSYGPGLSHWGTSIIMDGRFDDDKSLLFTYGQTTATAIAPLGGTTATLNSTASNTLTLSTANSNIVPGMLVTGTGIPDGTYVTAVNSTTSITVSNSGTALSLTNVNATFTGASSKALMSIRIAPSVDTGITAPIGGRELLNRMQLILKALDISLLNSAGTGNVLVQAFLNATPNANPGASLTLTNTAWTNAVSNKVLTPNSSLAQIADYAGGNVGVTGGEVTGGFFTNSTGSIDFSNVRDLGNSILGGGGTYNNSGVYPDGPDTLTIVVTNLATTPVSVLGRLSWSEAQA